LTTDASHPLASRWQAGRDILWLLISVPDRVRGRTWSATWHAPPGIMPLYNRELLSSGLLHPQGPMLLLDIDGLSQSEQHACGHAGVLTNR
jgi:hypothetical protein